MAGRQSGPSSLPRAAAPVQLLGQNTTRKATIATPHGMPTSGDRLSRIESPFGDYGV
jgi:hypothetical protein